MDAKIKKCPNCSQNYQLKSPSNPHGNIPLFLSCGHSMCEKCVRNIVQFEEPVECKICHRDMNVNFKELSLSSAINDKFYELFPVNLLMLGELLFHIMKSSHTQSKADESCYIDLHSILKNTECNKGECMECHNVTTKMCKQCSMVLCDFCFNKTHKNFIIFKNHVLQNIMPVCEPNNCKIHKDKPLDYYCKDCEKSNCMDCLVVGGDKSCKDHNIVSMDEVNETFKEELHDTSPEVDEIYRRLTKTAVDVGNLLNNIENADAATSEPTQMLCNIEQHFSKLMYTIQKHKNEIIDTIVTVKYSEKDSLLKAKEEVANAIKKTKTILNQINYCLDPKTATKMKYAALLDEAKKITKTPWYLKKDESNDPLKMTVNEDLVTLISDFVHLEGNAASVYKLKTTGEIPKDVEVPPPPATAVYPPELPKDVRQKEKKYQKPAAPVFIKDVPKYRSKSNSVSSLNSADSDNSLRSSLTYYGDQSQRPTVQQVQPFPESKHPKQLHEGSQELIYVSHIVDPYNFFVQRACHQGLVKEMLREFKNAANLPKPSIKHVAEGKVYLVYNKVDKMWQRGRIVSIDRKDVENPLFRVFCIDFGSIENVTVEKLRLLPPARVQSPLPLAINCTLANCKPMRAWSNDDSYLIQKIINNKQAIIHVRAVRATCNYSSRYECDVITFDDGISIAHALVFHERAVFINPKLQYPDITGIMETPKLFINNNDYKPKSTEEVYITHVVSPDKFYVRKRHLQSVYEKLSEDLDQEYSLSDNSGSIYLPHVGMACVVNVDKYTVSLSGAGVSCAGSWARGVVRALPGRARVLLRLPDAGAELLAHWPSLRHIQPKFATIAALATECHLAGVTPLNRKWSHGSVAFLRKFQERVLELNVEDHKRNSIGVTLYDKNDDLEEELCINTLMVKNKFAVTFGIFMFNKNNQEDLVIGNKSPLDVPKPQPKPNEIKILSKKDPPPKIRDQELEAKDKGPLRMEVKVLHYQSPSLLYVKMVHQQIVFNELFEKIRKHYGKQQVPGRDQWYVGDKCCTVCLQTKTWRRAVIIELEGDNAKVFYSDFALIETVPISSLKELTPEFASFGDAAIKCHLCGIVSADGQEWPTITKDFLKELIDAYPRIFITKSGVIKDKSMPVELWVYHTIQGGALEPNKSEWRCLNKRIIEQGLAVPDKTQMFSGTDDAVNDDMLSFLKNVTGSVSDYLQLEPIPTKPFLTKPAESPKSDHMAHEETDDAANATLDSSDTVFISDWLPPEPLPSKEFVGMPTYIDNDAIIYFHDVTQRDTLDLIRKALDLRFKDPDPKVKYAKWSVGEPCVARFFLDGRFYRGRVVEVRPDDAACLVHYIDYGNEELCAWRDLRKSIALYQIPVQARRGLLARVRPVRAAWDRQTLDYMHKSIVEKECLIKVVGEPVEGVLPIELKYDKLWINDHLVDFDLAAYIDGSKAVVRKFAPTKSKIEKKEPIPVESDSGPDYIVEDEPDSSATTENIIKSVEGQDWNKLVEEEEQIVDGNFITFPKNNASEFQCNITIINDLKKLELNIVHDSDTDELYESMYSEMQREAENQSPLNGVFENKACVSLYHEDDQWYRAEILQYNEVDGRIKVRYVDYGNIEVVTLADVREIDESWAQLPPASVCAALHGVHLNTQLDPKDIAQQFAETFLDKGPFHAKVIQESVPSVELRDSNGELVYENLIRNNTFLKYSDSNVVD